MTPLPPLSKAAEMDPKQHVVWAQLADAYLGQAKTKTGAEQTALMDKGFEAYGKAIELKPDDAGYHNNYALALARGKKFPEAQAELTKAAQIDPTNAGRYYFNLGALLVNNQQLDARGRSVQEGDRYRSELRRRLLSIRNLPRGESEIHTGRQRSFRSPARRKLLRSTCN